MLMLWIQSILAWIRIHGSGSIFLQMRIRILNEWVNQLLLLFRILTVQEGAAKKLNVKRSVFRIRKNFLDPADSDPNPQHCYGLTMFLIFCRKRSAPAPETVGE